MLTIGLSNVNAFVGYDQGTTDISDDLGMALTDVDVALAMFSEQGGSLRKWTAIKASVADATFRGVPAGLTVNVNTASIDINKQAVDGTVSISSAQRMKRRMPLI